MTIEVENIKSLMEASNAEAVKLTSLSDEVVSIYTDDLDSLMKDIYTDVISESNCDMQIIEFYMNKLANLLYWVADRVEKVAFYDDYTKSAAKEAYNDAYLNNQLEPQSKKKTVAELTAIAEGASLEATVTNWVYGRSVKRLRAKLDAANTMISTLSKIYNKRTEETNTRLLME